MINSGLTEKRAAHLQILSADQVFEIKRAAFDIMQNVGFKVLHAGARKMLKKAGALVRDEWVRVPEFVVTECLRTAPKGWTVFDRNGKMPGHQVLAVVGNRREILSPQLCLLHHATQCLGGAQKGRHHQ